MCGLFPITVIYNSYLVPNSVMTDEHFLRHLFSSTLLEALGLKDDSGVIYELINYRFRFATNTSPFCVRFFTNNELGDWDKMIDGLVNVRNLNIFPRSPFCLQMVGTFFIKASTYEFMKYNHITGSESYFYSFEYYGDASLWNFLFPCKFLSYDISVIRV